MMKNKALLRLAMALREMNADIAEPDTVQKIRQVLKKGYSKVDGIMVDHFTASAIIQVYDNLNDQNKEKYGKLSIKKMADVAWKLVK